MVAENEIGFVYDTIVIPFFNEIDARNWINSVVKNEGDSISNLQIIFCNDEQLESLNKKYLDHDTLTDIITFNYNDDYDGLAGDIFISYERIVDNAQHYGVSVFLELHRVIIHGVLHLLGYDDASHEDKQRMREKENYYLNLLS